jgi:hypothetical protein
MKGDLPLLDDMPQDILDLAFYLFSKDHSTYGARRSTWNHLVKNAKDLEGRGSGSETNIRYWINMAQHAKNFLTKKEEDIIY